MKRYQGTILREGTGLAVQSATVTVRVKATPAGSGALATIYEDAAGSTTKTNPVTTDAMGHYDFHVANGSYDLVITNGNETTTIEDVEIYDYDDIVTTTLADARYTQRSNNLSDVANAATARANLSAQPLDATLTALAAAAWTAGVELIGFSAADTVALKTVGAAAGNILDKAAGDSLYQALDATLTAFAAVAWSAGVQVPVLTAADTFALRSVGVAAATDILSRADGDGRYQPLDGELTAIAGLTSAADRLPYFTGAGTAALATFTAFGRSLVDDADAATGRATLGLAAVASSGSAADLATGTLDAARLSSNQKTRTITFIIDGGGSAITTGVKGYLEIPFACTINQVTMLADQSGSAVVDIWKDTYANFPPLDADSITAAAVPTITTATKSQDATLTGWTTAIAAGDILGFNVDSATTVTRVTLALKVTAT